MKNRNRFVSLLIGFFLISPWISASVRASFSALTDFRLDRESQTASAGTIPEKNPQKSKASSRPDMTGILQNCAEYCRKLANSALYFVCQEKIKEDIYEFRSNSYVYDYQLVKKGETIEETRTLLEENGRKKDLKNAPLKTQRFFSRKAVFGPVGFFGREWHDVYEYEFIKQDRVDGRETYVIKAKPKAPIEGKPNYGTLWVDKTDSSVIKMEVEGQSLAGFEKILEVAKRRGLKPILTTVHEYGILKNGLRFPSRTVFNEKYSGSRSRGFTQSKTEIRYENYRFFTVETKVEY